MKKFLLFLFIGMTPFFFGQIYQHDFGTTAISAHPYTVAPITLNPNLSNSSWFNSTNSWISFAGASGQAISLNNSSGTPTVTLTFDVASGYQMSITSFSSWFRRSSTGAQNWSMTINGVSVGAGSISTGGASTNTTNVSNPINNLTGTITVVLSFSGATGTGTVRIDDFTLNGTVTPTAGTTTVSLGSSNAGSEAAGTVITLTATASAFVVGDQTVDVTVTGTGITGTDYTLSSTTITIPNGMLQGTATFTVLDDADVEGTETATVTISNPSAGIVLGFPTFQDIVITDNDFNPDVSLSANASSGTEAAASVITLTATATYAVTGNQTVDVTVTGANVTGTDYTLSSGQITILSGQTTGTATFTIVDDLDLEATETATIAISNPSSGITIVAPTQVTVDIIDNDLVIYDLIINEVLADPNNAGLNGDANNDGINNFSDDEFVEIYNNENFSVDMSGYTLHDASLRHTFPAGTIVPAKTFITIFGGGTPTGIPGIAQASSTGSIGLSNSGDNVYVYDAGGYLVTSFSYTGSGGNNQSFGRSPDFTGAFVDHTTIAFTGREYSPGRENVALAPNVAPTDCGTTISLPFYEYFSLTPIVGAEEYEWRIDDGVTSSTYNSILVDSVRFHDFGTSNYAYNTTYAVDVRVKLEGIWSSYGTACNISTGPPTTSIQNQCGTTLANIHSNIFAWNVPGASGYRFEVSLSGTVLDTVYSPTRFFSLSALTAGAAYGTSYDVSAAVNVGGTWTAFSAPCLISTPTLPTSQLSSTYCGSTATSLTQNVHAVGVSGATAYRFRFTNGANVQTFDASNYWTSMNNFTLAYGTTYDVDISVQTGGTFGPYGTICTLSTPAASSLTSTLNSNSCGITTSTLTQNVFAVGVAGATAYRFRVTNGANVQTYVSSNYIASLANFTLTHATTYDVDVAVQVGGTFGSYGAICTITTPSPAAITTSLRSTQCGITTANMTQNLFANGVSGATKYRFRLTNGANVQTYDSPNYIAGLWRYTLTAGTTYDVDISVELNGTFGPYGAVCTITTPGGASIVAVEDKPTTIAIDKALSQGDFVFETKMYPNPFTDVIHLELNSDDTDSPVLVYIYDATGRLIESREMNLNIDSKMDLGLDYANGVYQVHVLQNDRMETIRVVKK